MPTFVRTVKERRVLCFLLTMYMYLHVQISTNVLRITEDVVLTQTASIQMEASTAAAGPVTMEMASSVLVR